ncbi:MAG: sulfite exporter TauE/SafE family protein [Alphaproteobacteria bacterium]|nr:sulfite exporter TauE/SafE family protein [Alphaproteobacteria bacterium]
MQIYLPIAEQSMNVFLVLGMGGVVGFLSGMFGVGGGFLMTPLLIFTGIPPAVAVATEANQIVASLVSGSIAQWRRNNVDVKMGLVLLAGGVVGSFIGVALVKVLRELGHVDLVISLSYVFFLGFIGTLMLLEAIRTYFKTKAGNAPPARRPGQHNWIHKLPFKMRFKRSKLYISAIPPVLVGMLVGLLAAIMGVGGGFIMVPAMIYLLRMPTNVVVGTSLFQIMFVTGLVTILHSVQNQTVDVVLALMLMAGGVIGAQIGAIAGQKLKGEQLRALLALMVLGMCFKLGFDLVVQPDELYSLATAVGAH